ncbi:hypothetical protein E2C01_073533 [Portunus trituberculatus]|uniref:Uncharacterized protein n=1 Tax=Portunus trituberculatus TaxID=210409 RepID=A0A5B7I5L3_PORTR|nr:hypothetical protein [Portunus trituberculatus]
MSHSETPPVPLTKSHSLGLSWPPRSLQRCRSPAHTPSNTRSRGGRDKAQNTCNSGTRLTGMGLLRYLETLPSRPGFGFN